LAEVNQLPEHIATSRTIAMIAPIAPTTNDPKVDPLDGVWLGEGCIGTGDDRMGSYQK
jgi:hypothetical protein